MSKAKKAVKKFTKKGNGAVKVKGTGSTTEWLNLRDSAVYLGVGKNYLRQVVLGSAKLPSAKKINGAWFISKKDLDARLAFVKQYKDTQNKGVQAA